MYYNVFQISFSKNNYNVFNIKMVCNFFLLTCNVKTVILEDTVHNSYFLKIRNKIMKQ